MTREEFMAVLERKPLGYICPFCKNLVRIRKYTSLNQFLRFNTVSKCKNCDPEQENYSVFFFGYKYLERFIFSFSFPDDSLRHPEESHVDFENTRLFDYPEMNCDCLEIGLKNVANPDKKLTFFVKKPKK